MRSVPFRIATLFVLLMALVVFSGVPSVAAAAPAVKAEKSCCEGCDIETGGTSEAAPCTAPFCPHVLCICADVVEPIAPRLIITEVVAVPLSTPLPVPNPFVPSIFRPPSLV